jgi:hypothetical protein
MANWRTLVLALSLGGCTVAGPPLVDMTDVNPVTYQRDLDQCGIEAQDSSSIGPLLAGVIIGGTMGMGAGAFAAPATAAAGGTTVGYGAAAGAVVGGGVSAASGAPLAVPPPPGQRQTLDQCLTSHGYKVLPR